MNTTWSDSGPAGDPAEGNAVLHRGRGIAAAAGLLLILATVAVIAADAVEPEFAAMAKHPHQLATSLLLRILAAGSSVGIAISLYPLLRKVDHALATGSVAFRTIEAVMYLAALSLLPLSEQSASASGERTVTIGVMVDSLTTVRHSAGLLAVFALAAGALMYYSVFMAAWTRVVDDLENQAVADEKAGNTRTAGQRDRSTYAPPTTSPRPNGYRAPTPPSVAPSTSAASTSWRRRSHASTPPPAVSRCPSRGRCYRRTSPTPPRTANQSRAW